MKKTIIVLAVLVVGVTLASANLLLNPGFEDGPVDDISSTNTPYWTWDVPSGNTHGGHWGDADVRNWRTHGGTNIGTIHNWGGTAADGGWWQEVTNSYGAGSTWEGSAWFWNDNSGSIYTTAYSQIKIEFYNGASALVGAATNEFALPGETWTEVSVLGTAPVDTAWSRLVITSGGQGTAGALQIDDTSLANAVPEPTTFVMLALAGVGIAVLRRKRR